MARIIIKCKYTGHYVFTPIDTERSPTVAGGQVLCPYCDTVHIWTVEEACLDDWQKKAQKLLVRQAS